MYGEDIDLSYRLLKGGYENWYLPVRILHYKGESTQKSSFRYVHVFYGAMLTFFRKHYSHMSILLSIPIKMAIYMKATMALLRMQLERMRQSLGFSGKARRSFPKYVFIGKGSSLERCRELAARKGLNATYLEGDEQTLPHGYHTLEVERRGVAYVVYDVLSFRYETILRNFATHPQENVYIGFYHPDSQMVVTAEEVIR